MGVERDRVAGFGRMEDGLVGLREAERGPAGRRPCFGWVDRLRHDPEWRDNLPVKGEAR